MTNPTDPEETAGQADFWEEANAEAQALVILSQAEAADLRRRIVERAATEEQAEPTLNLSQLPPAELRELLNAVNEPYRRRLNDAAPQMLAALQRVVKFPDDYNFGRCPFCHFMEGDEVPGHSPYCPWPAIRQAVAEATGEAPNA